jgi:uncharacterized protein with HEPN domain
MDIDIKTWLYDILNAIIEIESFFPGTSKDFLEYKNDLKTRRASERNVEIIGEAMNRILNRDSSIQLSSSRKIVDTRNRIIHGYDSVSDDIIWGLIMNHLPLLKSEIEELLKE